MSITAKTFIKDNIVGTMIIDQNNKSYLQYNKLYSTEEVNLDDENEERTVLNIVSDAKKYCNENDLLLVMY